MSLEADILVDRRRLKRRLTVWRVFAILLAIALIGVLLRDEFAAYVDEPHVARIEVSGLIIDDRRRTEALARVAENDNTKALLVHINSPGGTTLGGEELFHAIRKVGENKPVVAVVGTLGASAGYLGALAADHIVARTTSLTGSIGVLFETAEFSRLLDTIGVSTEAIKSGPMKDVPSPFHPLADADRAVVQALVDDVHQWFIDRLAERRRLARTEAAALADGRIFTGRQALAAKLIDEIGGEDAARNWLAEVHDVPLSLPTRPVEFTDKEGRLFRDVVGWAEKTLLSERLTLDGLISVWHPRQ